VDLRTFALSPLLVLVGTRLSLFLNKAHFKNNQFPKKQIYIKNKNQK
jgi:hypothetical protein